MNQIDNCQLFLFGASSSGQLGFGEGDLGITIMVPTELNGPGDGATWIQVSCGAEHTAISNTGALFAWGHGRSQILVHHAEKTHRMNGSRSNQMLGSWLWWATGDVVKNRYS